jgi:hypothetical protein
MTENGAHLDNLTRINLDDLLASFGWQASPLGVWLTTHLFDWPARQFARQMVRFDQDIAHLGLRESSSLLLPSFAPGLQVNGAQHIPPAGPLLLLSNHPGMVDTLALFTAIPRPDLHIVGLERPFLKQLPALSRQMIYIPEQEEGRLLVIRSMLARLQSGSAILTFPAGHIEPDPAVLPGAVASLDSWSESIALFIRKVPETQIVGAVVSHVLAPQAVFHPLTRLRRRQADRERLGASIQLIMHTLFPHLWPLTPEITFTPPLAASTLAPLRHSSDITRAVTDYIRPYMAAASHL